MIAINKGYEKSNCEINTMENHMLATATIDRIKDSYIKIVKKNSELPLLDYGTLVKVSVFNNELGLNVFVGTVLATSKGFLKLVDVISVFDYEKRNYFRIEAQTKGEVVEFVPPDQYECLGGVMLLDLSIGGALLAFEDDSIEYKTGSVIYIRFKMNQTFSTFKCRVRRVIEKDRKVKYGCEFENVSQLQADALCKYIFQRQREIIHMSRQDQMKR